MQGEKAGLRSPLEGCGALSLHRWVVSPVGPGAGEEVGELPNHEKGHSCVKGMQEGAACRLLFSVMLLGQR